MASVILPEPAFSFFAFVEPILTIGGSVYACFFSSLYYANYLPALSHGVASLPAHPTSIGTIQLLGNCYLLLALISYMMVPAISSAKIDDDTKASLFRKFFAVLAICDVTHVAWSLYGLGEKVAWDVHSWSELPFSSD